MKAFVLKRRAAEVVVTGSLFALVGLGVLASLLGAFAAPDAAGFWQNFVGGAALLVLMTIPIWFLQRWRAMARPALTGEGLRAFRRTNLALIALWILGLGIAALGLAINVRGQASLEANVAMGLFLAYMAGWGLLVFGVLRRQPAAAGRLRGQWLRIRTR